MYKNITDSFINYLMENHHVLIGNDSANRLLQESSNQKEIVVHGRSLQSGDPITIYLNIDDFYSFLDIESI